MNAIKSVPVKRAGKQDREKKVLLGLVEYYIKTGRPVGSNTLKEAGFGDLSSATIRNYFAHLEKEGYLTQPHSSGGRLPTALAYRTYARTYADIDTLETSDAPFQSMRQFESKEIAAFLQESADLLSQHTNCAVFLSAPRFDHDFVRDIKLVPIDGVRCLCVLITDFGMIQTEIMQLPIRITSFAIKRIESYFHWRLTGLNPPENLESEEEDLAKSIYNELMVRYIVGYSHFIDEEIHCTGFSRLLAYPEFHDVSQLATSLGLFENARSMRLLLRECTSLEHLKFWIGDDLTVYTSTNPNCSVLAIPYYINRKAVGAVGLLGPTRIPYRALFCSLRLFSEFVSEALTRNIFKYKINFRQPSAEKPFLHKEEHHVLGQSRLMLLEDKRNQE